MRFLLGVLLPLAMAACGANDFDAAGRAYREGRFGDALDAFAELEKAAGEDAPAELLYDKALAALRAGNLPEAQASAERAAARGEAGFSSSRDFMLGNIGFARCLAAEAEADLPGAPPFMFDFAIEQAEIARDSWKSAAMSRPDWPAARRNVERALLKIADLERKRGEAQERNKKKGKEVKLKPPPDVEEHEPGEEADLGPQLGELSPEMVKSLLKKLDEKEKEKMKLRRARRRAQRVVVERDW